MTNDTDYTPIDCAEYSRHELTIMRQQPLRLAWHDQTGAACLETVHPIDLQTCKKVEYLLARKQNGQMLKLRLDKIIRAALYEDK